MAINDQKFCNYTLEFKLEAVRLYLEEELSYQSVSDQMEVPSSTQIKQWVKKHKNGESLGDKRQSGLPKKAWRTGRPKTKFASIEEELAFLKAEVEYQNSSIPIFTERVVTKKARFEILEALRGKYRLACLFEIEVSRAGYYKWRKTRERAYQHAQQENILKDHIMAIHRLRPYYGYLRMTVALRKEGFLVNHKRVYRLMNG
jgi:transposase-like protein